MPERTTVWGLPLPVSAKLRVAVRVPVAEGLNTTLAEQLLPAARLVPQLLLEMLKSPALEPVMETLLMVIADVVPLFNAVAIAELLEPTTTDGKESEVGLVVTLPEPPELPVPESATV